MVVRYFHFFFRVNVDHFVFFFEIRYAKNAYGQMGVIPENYVQALADPPEPNEPPPLTTFNQGHSSSNAYNGNNNNARTSFPPPYDHQYMNPASTGNWQSHEPTTWSPPPPPQQQPTVRYMHYFSCTNHLLLLY